MKKIFVCTMVVLISRLASANAADTVQCPTLHGDWQCYGMIDGNSEKPFSFNSIIRQRALPNGDTGYLFLLRRFISVQFRANASSIGAIDVEGIRGVCRNNLLQVYEGQSPRPLFQVVFRGEDPQAAGEILRTEGQAVENWTCERKSRSNRGASEIDFAESASVVLK